MDFMDQNNIIETWLTLYKKGFIQPIISMSLSTNILNVAEKRQLIAACNFAKEQLERNNSVETQQDNQEDLMTKFSNSILAKNNRNI